MSAYSKIATVLYVETEEGVRKGYEKALNRHAKELYIAVNGEEGLDLYIEYQPDIVITDINMPKMNGIEMSKAIKKINPGQQIIITTAHSEAGYFMEAIELQVSAYLLKPVDKNILTRKVLEIAKNQQLNDEVYEQQALMREIANLQSNMLIVYDASDNMIFANTAFLHFFNTRNIEQFKTDVDHLHTRFIQAEQVYFYDAQNTHHWTHEIEQLAEGNRLVSMSNLNNHIIDTEQYSDHQPSTQEIFLVNIKQVAINNHKICTFSKITSITTQKSEFEIKAFIDELTQISNRAKFNQMLNKEIERYQRYHQELSLIIFDIDHFKHFNDTHGHQLGDEILHELAQLVNKRIRATDLLARWGGEEFVIILTNTNLNSAVLFAEEIRLFIQKHDFINKLKLTCSFGVTGIQDEDYEEVLFKRADTALYQAKMNGRNMVISI